MAFDSNKKEHLEAELLPFLAVDARPDVKGVAVRYFLELTGSKEGRDFIADGDKFLTAIMSLTGDENKDVSKDAYLALINLSSDSNVSWKIMNMADGPTFVVELLHRILKSDFLFADEASSVVANITRLPGCAKSIAELVLSDSSPVSMERMVSVLCQVNYNKQATLHYLGPILSNLTQVHAVREVVMDKKRCILQKLLPFTEFPDSITRRGGVIGTLKNCCFEYDYHPWLLSEEVDMLSRLLLPLAGGEEFDDDEMEKLPVDLQYLPPDKTREPDPDLRTMLVESIMQLCSTQSGRLQVKDSNAYVILRELHKWEKDPKAKLACQKLCELLISDEPAPGMEELHRVAVPGHLGEEFDKLDQEILQDFREETKQGDDGNVE